MNPASSQEHVDREGAMAKSDLYKLANYSLKLFKKLHDDDQLEGWVQAKVTKAADYIASVYHYLEYEMKFSEYGQHLDNVETLSESQRAELKSRLFEAKEKMKELKMAQAKKAKGKEEVKEGTEMCPTCGTPHAVATRPSDKALKAAKKHKALHNFVDKKIKDANGNGIPDDEEVEECGNNMPMTVAEAEHKNKDAFDASAKKGDTYKTAKGGKVTKTEKGVRHEKQYSDSYKGHGEGSDKDLDESKKSKPDFLDMDKDGNKKETMKKAVADKKKNPFAKKTNEALKGGQKKLDVDQDGDIEADDLADLRAKKKEKKVDEAKPSAGMSKDAKSALVKKAKSGGDIGKPGKCFDKVAKSAGGGEKGKKIAAAAMWKNAHESVELQPVVIKESADLTRIKELTQKLLG